MILSFKQKFSWGEETFFKWKILNSVPGAEPFQHPHTKKVFKPKFHTIRAGARWKPGMTIEMANGVRTKQYHQFNKDIPELSTVKSIQRVDLIFRPKHKMNQAILIDEEIMWSTDGKEHFFGSLWMKQFIQNDGFDNLQQFFRFFDKPFKNYQLIHFTDLKY